MPDPTPPDFSTYDVAPAPAKAPAFVPPTPVVLPPETEAEAAAEAADALHHRGAAIVGYTIFLIPLLVAPKSRFARFHANQALLVFITAVIAVVALVIGSEILGLVLAHLPGMMGVFVTLVNCTWTVAQLGLFLGLIALAITGIVNAANLEKKPLPVIGHFILIKEELPTP